MLVRQCVAMTFRLLPERARCPRLPAQACRAAALACALLAGIAPGAAIGAPAQPAPRTPTDSAQPWVGAWEAAAQAIPQGPLVPRYRKAAALLDQTVREIVVPELSGHALRVRISNRWSDQPLRIGAASVARRRHGAELDASSLRRLRFQGQAGVLVAPHAEVWSDPLAWPVRAGKALAISLFLPGPTLPGTWHRLAGQVQYVSTAGDHSTDPTGSAFPARTTSYLWLDRLDVQPDAPSAALVAIGDSITDGMRSSLNARRSWPQQLAARLRAGGVRDLAVLNAGISGNRLLADSTCWGQALDARFARDALDVSGVRAIIVLIGINDIEFGYTPRRRGLDCDAPHLRPGADQLEQALAALAGQAHARGLRIYAGTLTPASLPPEREALRRKLNTWIRASRDFDGVVDFDAALRDPRDPARMLPRLDSGDHEHPDDAGYAAMAAAAWPVALRESPAPHAP